MSDIELACHTSAWGPQVINSLADIERAGYRGIEMSSTVVEQYEDRVGVFIEILTQHRLQLMGITAGGAMWPGMNLDEEVERNLNIARFVKAAGAKLLTLYPPRPNPDSPLEDEDMELDLVPAATAYGEIARRAQEMEITVCLHPECGSLVDNAKKLDYFMQMADPEALKLCLDIGFLGEAGIPLNSFIESHKKKIGLVHLKDIKAKDLKSREHRPVVKKPHSKKQKEPAAPHAVELGKGALELTQFVEALMKREYSGWATIEFDALPGRNLGDIATGCHKYAEQHLDLVL